MKFILRFDEISIRDVPLVGGKNASLGEMLQNTQLKKAIPNGFAITASAYRYLLEEAGILKPLKAALKGLNVKDGRALARAGKKARELILGAEFPPELTRAIESAYKKLGGGEVAVRSSATAEDLPTASFAGQQESFLHISGTKQLLDACRRCFASLFTNRAIAYRVEKKFDHFKVALSIGIQKMVRSDQGSSGVIFTLDTESGFQNVIFITGAYGVGESVVQGSVNPDEFYVFKPTMTLIDKRLGEKATQISFGKTRKTPLPKRKQFCLTDKQVLQLAQWSLLIEKHYKKPMDIEWAKDGSSGKLFIVQARPETVQSQKNRNILKEYHLVRSGTVLARGKSVGNKIAQGKVHVIKSVKDIAQFKKGEILVTDMTDPDWVPIMGIASAIITNRGGRTSHAAIVSRELGLPCIVGTNNATEVLKTGHKVTVSCAEGEQGLVYDGFLKFRIDSIDMKKIPKTKTKIMINVGTPDSAFETSFIPNDGVGLAREEFIISESIRIHPMALVHFDKVKDKKTRKQIEALTTGYSDKKAYFVDRLAMGVARIAAAFYPKEVILRFSDFKTNEYVNLLGGKYFEPEEENPMIGWRGASRYYHPAYKEGFGLECKAVKKVREEMGLTNLKVMIPVCRTPDEGRKVLATMKEFGLARGKKGLEVYVMCEVPSNAILSEEFCSLFDGFSIGSNDLTQMTLAVDRDSALVADLFNERNEAVLLLIKEAIHTAKKHKRKIGICGDAPSTYPEFAEFLVDCGINSISLSPDAALRTRTVIAKREAKNDKRGRVGRPRSGTGYR